MARNDLLRTGNRLKLGLFGFNCSSGRTYTTVPERWEASWENNLRLARIAEATGFECLIPIARWKGYGGESNPNGTSWEAITWAAGLLASTDKINVFATIHVPLVHPVLAAKQLATVDHLSAGRLGVNVVCGWNDDEFQMFGVSKHDHAVRYEQGIEWWSIVTRIWAGGEPFDFSGEHYRLEGVQGSPLPFGGKPPLMMNAGTSPAGRDFALRFSDMHFDAVRLPEESADRVARTKSNAAQAGRALQVWTPVGIVCRPTQKEAVEFTQHIVEHADLDAIGHIIDMHARDTYRTLYDEGAFGRIGEGPIERQVLARGNFCAIGDPDHVAGQIARLHAVGFDGLAVNFVNYLDDVGLFVREVLPRLEALGLREAVAS